MSKQVNQQTSNGLALMIGVFFLATFVVIFIFFQAIVGFQIIGDLSQGEERNWLKFDKFITDTGTTNYEAFGTFGDFFGGLLNPLLSFIVIILLIYSIKTQVHELRVASAEYRLARISMEGSSIALEEQSITLKKNSFDRTFFRLIDLLNSSILSIDFKDDTSGSHERIIGRRFFEYFDDILHESVSLHHKSDGYYDSQIAFNNVDKRFYHYTSHYINTFYQVISFIDENEILERNEKLKYISILKSQISNYELNYIYYKIKESNYSKLRKLINEYNI